MAKTATAPEAGTRKSSDPARSSFYVSNALYDTLVDEFTGWRSDELEVDDAAERDGYRRFLEREARLLAELRFDEWVALFAPECVYWVPTTPEAGDPRQEVSIAFDDRRRLEDRIYRLQLSHAWSQRPASRTVRLVSNVEAYRTGEPDVTMLRSNFVISEFWAEDTRIWSGWSAHRLRRIKARPGFEILAKQVNLIDCDQNLRNPSIVL